MTTPVDLKLNQGTVNKNNNNNNSNHGSGTGVSGGSGGSGNGSNKRPQSVSLDTISSSLDSPDMEVKRIMMMDDSSSIGSIDSYSQARPMVTSISSTDSIDSMLIEQQQVLNDQLSLDSSIESINEQCIKMALGEVLEVPTAAEKREAESFALQVIQITQAVKSEQTRARKTSWISNPSTIDKLMSLFQHPTAIFNRTTTTTSIEKTNEPALSVDAATGQTMPQGRKENSLGNLFNWAAGTNKKEEQKISAEEGRHVLQVASVDQVRADVTGCQIPLTATDMLKDAALMADLKENISPEHTITANTLQNLQRGEEKVVAVAGRVKFELGSNEDLSDGYVVKHSEDGGGEAGSGGNNEDREDLMPGGDGPNTLLPSKDSCVSLIEQEEEHHGLGQIARDSMVILSSAAKGGATSGATTSGGGQHVDKTVASE